MGAHLDKAGKCAMIREQWGPQKREGEDLTRCEDG